MTGSASRRFLSTVRYSAGVASLPRIRASMRDTSWMNGALKYSPGRPRVRLYAPNCVTIAIWRSSITTTLDQAVASTTSTSTIQRVTACLPRRRRHGQRQDGHRALTDALVDEHLVFDRPRMLSTASSQSRWRVTRSRLLELDQHRVEPVGVAVCAQDALLRDNPPPRAASSRASPLGARDHVGLVAARLVDDLFLFLARAHDVVKRLAHLTRRIHGLELELGHRDAALVVVHELLQPGSRLGLNPLATGRQELVDLRRPTMLRSATSAVARSVSSGSFNRNRYLLVSDTRYCTMI